jgi:hypothetical protein
MRNERRRSFWPAGLALVGAMLTLPAERPGQAVAAQIPTPGCPSPIPPVTWSTKAIATTDFDEGRAMAVDTAQCAVYVAGNTSGTLGAASAGSGDGFLARYATAGTLAWIVQFGSSGYEHVQAVAVDGEHNVYVAGYTDGSLPSAPTINLGGEDLFLAKYDQNGVEIWTRQLGGVDDDYAHGLAVDQNGDVFVVGRTTGVLIGASAGDEDYFLARYDTDGNLDMLVQNGTSGEDRGMAVAVGPSGNVYVLGQTDGVLGASAFGDTDLFVAKYDPSGAAIWIEQRGTVDLDLAGGIAVSAEGHVFVSGAVNGSLDGHVHQGALDIVVIRYDANGTWRWTDQRGTSTTDVATGITVSSDGAPHTVGWTGGALDGNVSAGAADVVVLKHGRGGAWRWTAQYGGTGGNYANGMAIGPADDLFVVGDGGGTIGGIANLGFDDVFGLRFTRTGQLR